MKLRRVTAWACLGSYLSAVAPALAAGAAPPAAPSGGSSAAPVAPAAPSGGGIADVVRLKDGSMLRGAIIEFIRGESVTLLLPSGQTRSFKLTEVEYAGPVAGAPAAQQLGTPPSAAEPAPVAPPPPAESAPAAPSPALEPHVHFEAAEPLNFGVLTSTAEASVQGWRSNLEMQVNHFDMLCTAPCDAKLPKGSYRFSLSREGKTVTTEREVAVAPGDTVHGEYKSFRSMRIAGYVIAGVGGAGGMIYSLSNLGSDSSSCDYSSSAPCSHETGIKTGFWVGFGVMIGSILVGTVLALKGDEAAVTVSPGVAPSSDRTVADRRSASGGSYEPRGLTLGARF